MNVSKGLLLLVPAIFAAACSGGSHATPTTTPQPEVDANAVATSDARSTAVAVGEPTAIAETTALARTVIAGGPTAIAQATSAAATSVAIPPPAPAGSVVATLVPGLSKTPTAIAATVIAGGPTAIARATEIAGLPTTATPAPRLQLTLSGPTTMSAGSSIDLEVRIDGPATALAAFNFDVVYDQRLVTLDAPAPELSVLDAPDRQFQCGLPTPSGDIDPDPNVGRARLVCFSYGGAEASAPNAPFVLARITLHAVAAGQPTLTFENAAVFTPDAKNVTIAAVPVQVTVK